MPQPMAARTMRKAIAASTMPSTLPPTSTSESSPASPPAVAARPVRGPQDRVYRPPAKRAGRPAPAIRPNTTIFHRALRLIQDIVLATSLRRCAPLGRDGLGRLGRGHAAGPLRVDVVVVHLGGAGPVVDEPGQRGEEDEVNHDPEDAADPVRDGLGRGAEERRRA